MWFAREISTVPPTGVVPGVLLQGERKRKRTGNSCVTSRRVTPGRGALRQGCAAVSQQGHGQECSRMLGGCTRLPGLPGTLQILRCVKWRTKTLPPIPATLQVSVSEVQDLLTTHYFLPGHFLLAWLSCHFLGRTAPWVQKPLVNKGCFTPYVQVQGGQGIVPTLFIVLIRIADTAFSVWEKYVFFS